MSQTLECPLKIAIAANFLVAEIRDSLMLWLETVGISANLIFSPYDSIIQQLLNPASAFGDADFGAILLQIEKWRSTGHRVRPESLTHNFDTFVRSLHSAASNSRPPALLVMSCPPSLAGRDEKEIIQIENKLREQLQAFPTVDYISSNDLSLYYPVENYGAYFEDNHFDLESVPYSQLCFATLGTVLARRLYTKFKGPRKVIVIDCDNTLWSGICGEVGPKAVTIGIGNRELQEALVRQAGRGQLICLCSKNNESDVVAVFEQNHRMLLKRQHVTAWRINWDSKSENMKSLAAELRLGMDAFIFLDDEPFECEAMRRLCPEVFTIQVPQDQAAFSRMLVQLWDLDSRPITKEDEMRGLYYRQNKERDRARASMISLDDFLESLELKVAIGPLDIQDVPRAAQLMMRVNQFNLNGIRRTVSDLTESISNGTCCVVRVADRFGDYGFVGLLIYKISAKVLRVESLLLSCRALGRGVERRLGIFLVEKARGLGCLHIEFEFYPTSKNSPMRAFLVEIGATEVIQGKTVISVDTIAERTTFHPESEPPNCPGHHFLS